MDLKWWPVVVVGLFTLAAATVAAALLPMAQVRRALRPLAHVERLTRLPEYARVYRLYFFSVVVTGVLLLATFLTALTASARPAGMSSSTRAFDTAYPEDVMLCVGEPVSDRTTADFLDYYASYTAQLKHADTLRIGLTSTTLRVVPLTRDYHYVADRFKSLAGLASIQQDLDGRKPVSNARRAALQRGVDEFSRRVDYVDYAPSLNDVLTLCMAGFPSHESRNEHRRQLIYLGPSALRDPSDHRPPLFSDDAVRQMATQAGVQINAVARSDIAALSTQGNDSLHAIADASGGKFFFYNPVGAAQADNGADPTLIRYLDQIRSNAPKAELPGGQVISSRSWDSPEPLLIAGVVVAALLCVSLAVLRR